MDDAGKAKRLAAFVAEELSNIQTSWNVGAFGATAEFHHQIPPAIETVSAMSFATVEAGGAIRVRLDSAARLVAYEILSARAGLWLHGAAICLPDRLARMAVRTTVTELGVDIDAIRPLDRNGILFDLGLGLATLDFCVRTGDAGLVQLLRHHEGKPLLADARLIALLKEASPHRVAQSRLARIEVFQPIGKEGGASPDGPHTHLLPELLRVRRTHASTLPIPEGWLPCVSLYPASPVQDEHGHVRQFDTAAYWRFDAWLAQFGEPTYVAEKQALFAHVRAGRRPHDVPRACSRLTRNARRIAVRQLAQLDGASPILAAWQAATEPGESRPMVDAH